MEVINVDENVTRNDFPILFGSVDDYCPFDCLSPYSQALVLGIQANNEISIECHLEAKMWEAWSSEYGTALTVEQQKRWRDLIVEKVGQLTFTSMLHRAIVSPSAALFKVLGKMGWLDVLTIQRIVGNEWQLLLHAPDQPWTFSIAEAFVEHIALNPSCVLQLRPDENVVREVEMLDRFERWSSNKLSAFARFGDASSFDFIDWFYLRSLMLNATGHIFIAGTVPQLFLDNRRPDEAPYTNDPLDVNNVYMRMAAQKQHVTVFYEVDVDISRWLHMLQLMSFCEIHLEGTKRYAHIYNLQFPLVHFKVYFIRLNLDMLFSSTERAPRPSLFDCAARVAEMADVPAKQCAVFLNEGGENQQRSFVYLKSLANVRDADSGHQPLPYFVDENKPYGYHFADYTVRGINVKKSAELCYFGQHRSRLLSSLVKLPHNFEFTPLSQRFTSAALPLCFREEEARNQAARQSPSASST